MSEYKFHLRVIAGTNHNLDAIRLVEIYSDCLEDALVEVFNQVDLENSYEVKEFCATMGKPSKDQLLQLMENSEDEWDYIIQIKEMNSGKILYESENPIVYSKTVRL